ncbi:hypothetical protein ISG33_06485 [Glaciecola sp. MH2013]|nr:hypothetical protein [Glaciecola sp. MH2013]
MGLSMSLVAPSSFASIELLNVDTENGATKVVLGGYAKADIRHVNGDIAYQDYWVANFPGGEPIETSHTGFNVRESRVNFKVTHGEVSGFIEWDFYGGGGNEVVSNSSNERLRHFYITYKNWMVGQNWSTFMPLAALPEALDFGGPHVGEVFIRQTQVRYTSGNWQFAIENPETNGDGDNGTPASAVGGTGTQIDKDEAIPDFVIRYNHKADWGQLSFGTLIRQVDQGGIDEVSLAANFSGRINTIGKDDLRFQVSVGEPGRYVAAGLTPDIVSTDADEVVVEKTTAFTLAYRHFWTEKLRSTIFYGAAETDVLGRERSHWGVNLITDITEKMDAGFEIGEYAIDDENIQGIASAYGQFSLKFTF